MSKDYRNIDPDILLDGIREEIDRLDLDEESKRKAKEIILNKEKREILIAKAQIDKLKLDEAIDTANQIQSITNKIVILRHNIGEAAKVLGFKLFFNNSETSRIAASLPQHIVTDNDKFNLFINDLHKYLIQSAHWGPFKKHEQIKPVISTINIYRQNFAHIFDMKNGGKGTDMAYQEIGKINARLIGHKIIKVQEYPTIQIRILEEVYKMLEIFDDNIETWHNDNGL